MASVIEERPGLGALSAHLADEAAQLRPSVVSIHTGPRRALSQRSGAGVIWRSDGLIVTNAHVVHEPRARVVLDDGRDYEADLVTHEPSLDLAALRVPAGELPAARVGDSSALRVGQLVFAMGHPSGRRTPSPGAS
jgi:serine protease Do